MRAVKEVRDGVLDGIISAGKPLSCIFETRDGKRLIAHSDTYAEVSVECDEDLRGEIALVKPLYHKDGVIYGEII